MARHRIRSPRPGFGENYHEPSLHLAAPGPGDVYGFIFRGPAGRRLAELEGLWADVAVDEEAAGLVAMSAPDPGFARSVLSWTAGGELAEVLDGGGADAFTGGEFVRNVRLVADLLRQVAKVGPPRVARTARRAVGELERGVVSLTREFAGEGDDDEAAESEDTVGGVR